MIPNSTTRVGILGYGQIGRAVATFYESPFVRDLPAFEKDLKDLNLRSFDEIGPEGLEILHVAIPCKGSAASFSAHVLPVIKQYCPDALVIIHSTVALGATELIGRDHKMVVHSPVRGVHPNLREGILAFVKYIGADFAGAGRVAHQHFTELGITAKVLHKSRTTELLKLLDTTYYGLAIAYHAYAAKLCAANGVPFDMAMTHANMSYNMGYEILGKGNVVRPVLAPPENDKIGGHCVIPNAELLRKEFGGDPILEAILRHKP